VTAFAEKANNKVFSISCNQEPRAGGPEAGVLKPRIGREIGSQEIIFGAIFAFFCQGISAKSGIFCSRRQTMLAPQ
jgi:hypothetical protein